VVKRPIPPSARPSPDHRCLCRRFPDEFFWAIGAQSPALLNHMLSAIDAASRPEKQSKPRAHRLVDRKPEGNA